MAINAFKGGTFSLQPTESTSCPGMLTLSLKISTPKKIF